MASLSARSRTIAQHLETPELVPETDPINLDSRKNLSADGPLAVRPSPALFHKVKNQRSILALAVSASTLFAGTQGGEILVWSLDTYEQSHTVPAHRGAVLGLFLSRDGKLLFSCAGDAIVNVWCTQKLTRIYSIYSTYDVGDVFCVVYSSELQCVYLGAQNTSIQWYDISRKDSGPLPDLGSHPSHRSHRFFDSKGPGGISTPRLDEGSDPFEHGGQTLEIDKTHIVQYAHYGYVYCMLLARNLTHGDFNGDALISGGGDGSIKLWHLDANNGGAITELAALENGDNSVLTMALNDTLLYAGRLEGDVNVWDLDTRQLIQTVKAYTVDVLTLSVGYGFMFTGGASGQAKVFERYKSKAEWKAHDELILASVVIKRNDKAYLVTGGNDDCVAIWDLTEFFTLPPPETQASNEQLVQSLNRLISFRTVSSKPEYAEDCRQGASWLRNLFKRFGASTELLRTDANYNPVVYAHFKGRVSNGKRILFYGHYDVIAAENYHSRWNGDPFTLEGRDGYLYGRGVSDNKGPILAAIYAVADLVADQKLETDIVFLIEGEEECGSRGFENTVRRNKHIVGHVDWILLANSYWLNDEVPCLTYGLRGVINLTITIEGGHRDLHSGVNGSNLMNEPLKDLVALVSRLSDPDGHINIPGFYDHVLPITKAEERWYTTISKTLAQNSSKSEDAQSLKARWREPSLTLHGFKTSGSGNPTIIPHLASVAVSFRLVPNQDASELLQSSLHYIHHHFSSLKTSNTLSVTTGHPVEPWLGDPDNQIFQTLESAIVEVWGLGRSENDMTEKGTHSHSTYVGDITNQPSRSIVPVKTPKDSSTKPHQSQPNGKRNSTSKARSMSEDSFGSKPKKPLYIREGGSIPAIRFLEKEFGAPAAQLPCGQASDNAHLDNERLRLSNLYNSRKIFKTVFQELPLR